MQYKFLTPTTLKAPFGWVGGKSRLAKDIIELMPPHKRYIEVFGGGLSVLYAKPKLKGSGSNKYAEVVNDINGDLSICTQLLKLAHKVLVICSLIFFVVEKFSIKLKRVS